MSQSQYDEIMEHFYPGDGLESATVLICGRAGINRNKLCVRKVICVPNEKCKVRRQNFISWPGEFIESAIDNSEDAADSLILMHSHPSGMFGFSILDDQSDEVTMNSIYDALPTGPHGSAVVVPDGSICTRIYDPNGEISAPCSAVLNSDEIIEISSCDRNYILPFSNDMRNELLQQSACVVGVSGTGSIVAEMLARLGIGCLILIDDDKIERKNLNRIINSTFNDAKKGTSKVEMMSNAIRKYRKDILINVLDSSICDSVAIETASDADIIFSCVDTYVGRLYCNLISQCSQIPLIDVGVGIPVSKDKNQKLDIIDVVGRIDYVKPDGPSLMDREVIKPEYLAREEHMKSDPKSAKLLVERGYIKGVAEEAPAVISLNMRASSTAVNEYLTRLFNFRIEKNSQYSQTRFSLAYMVDDFFPDSNFKCSNSSILGRGLAKPLLGLPSLSESS